MKPSIRLKPLTFFVVITLFFFTGICTAHNTVNPVLGDLSFISRFGFSPSDKTDETMRIRTHLEFVEQVLRKRNVSYLPKSLQQKRKQMLDLLHTYLIAEKFPVNYDFPGKRLPCFIDQEGRICAVGYLVEQTAGREVAEEINSKFQYDDLLNMNDPLIAAWIASSGLTREECAMIQPTYGFHDYYPDPIVTPIGPGTPPILYVTPAGPTKKERELTAKLDSQLVINSNLQTEVDSLHSALVMSNLEVDSLTEENQKKQDELQTLTETHESKSNTLGIIIWVLVIALGIFAIISVTSWMKVIKLRKGLI